MSIPGRSEPAPAARPAGPAPALRSQPVLLNPGPVNVSERVRAALNKGDLCHREPEYAELLLRTGARLGAAFGCAATHTPALLTGSGTAAVEMAILAAVRPGRRLLVAINGVYGERMAAMARAHGLEVVELQAGWTEPLPLDRLEERLADPAIDALALVHHETTTGLLNPVAEAAALAQAAGKLVVLDTVSGLGGERLDLGPVDLAVSTANKCLGGMPGISFVLVSDRARARLAEVPRRSVYLDLAAYLEATRTGSPPFTPAFHTMWALEAALEELLAEGLERRLERFARISSYLREQFEALGMELLLPPPLRSNTITAVRLPRGLSYAALHDGLKARGFVIYAGQGRLAQQIFRVANMGQVPMADYERFVAALRELLPS